MNAKTRRQLDNCLEKAADELKKDQDNPQYFEGIRKKIIEVGHKAAMYWGRIMESQARAYTSGKNKKYNCGVI